MKRGMSWEPVWIEEKVGMSRCENMYCLQSLAKVTRDRKTSCVSLCTSVCGCLCVHTDQQLGESATAKA